MTESKGAVRAADEAGCRWPECICYSVQGPQKCRRQFGVYTNSKPGKAWNAAYPAAGRLTGERE